jgi:hypothetical protein
MNRRIGSILLAIIVTSLAASGQANKELNDKLFEAVRAGDAAQVTALLDKGADVNAKYRYGMTALFKAAERGNLEVTKILLARGVDVKVKDTFYGATALSWALQNDHNDVAQAILAKDPASVDEVLLTGARRGGSEQLIDIALAQGGAKAESLTMALAAAMSDPKKTAIAEKLKKAGAVPPPTIDVAILQTYTGNYKSERGTTMTLMVKDGGLWAQFMSQPPLALAAVDKVSFKPVDFDGLVFTMTAEGDKIVGFNLKQGTTNTVYKKE